MFKYEKEFLFKVGIEKENPQYATLLQEKLCGVNMGIKQAIQYFSQSVKNDDTELSDLLLKIATEKLSYFEMISQTIKLLNGKGNLLDYQTNLSGNDNIVATGDSCTDLLSDIAAEEQAKLVYQYLYEKISDVKVREMLNFLINCTEEHSKLLREAFNKIQRNKIKADFKLTKEPRMCFSFIKPKLNENSYEDFKRTPPTIKF